MQEIYLLKDLAKISAFSIYTIKYYLKIGLVREAGRFPETNFRYFDNNTVVLLEKIRQLRREKKSIKAIQALLAQNQLSAA